MNQTIMDILKAGALALAAFVVMYGGAMLWQAIH